jgi:radical SAM superfamily enzyme YgiQ (UPF0313 family)
MGEAQMGARGKRVVLAWNHSVIEPLFALYLGGLMRDRGHAWTGVPIRKYDYEPLFRRVEDFGATDVGFNVYSGNHRQVFAAADRLRARGIRVHIGGPHATYFAAVCAEHADWVYRGQSFDSFAAVLDDDPATFVRESLFHRQFAAALDAELKQRRRTLGIGPQALPAAEAAAAEATARARIAELADADSRKGEVERVLRSRVLFRDYLSDTFPKPDRATFYRDNPEFAENPIKNTICGEGCPFACTYCYNVAWNSPEMYGRFRRRVLRRVDDVIEELRELKDYPTRLIYIQDDVFGFEMGWLREFMPRLRDEVDIPFHAQLRLELASGAAGRERLAWMKRGGCTGVTVAVESGSYAVRKHVLDRPMRDAHILEGCRNIREVGLTLRTEQMLGVPTRTTRAGGSALHVDLLTLELNVLLRPEIAWSAILAPYGGTELGKLCAELDLYPAERLATNDDVSDSFFDESALAYGALYKDQVRVLQRLFSTLAHVDWGHVVAARFLNEVLPKFSHGEIEAFLGPAKDLAKRTKAMLYDTELYRIDRGGAVRCAGVSGTNDKGRDELLAGAVDSDAPTVAELSARSWNAEQRAALDALSPLWRHLPSGATVAANFLERFPSYEAAQRAAFLGVAAELGRIMCDVARLGAMDREAAMGRLIEDEIRRLSRSSAAEPEMLPGTQEELDRLPVPDPPAYQDLGRIALDRP